MPLPRKFRKAAIEATATSGGFFRDFDRHSAVHFQRGSTLIVTFDNMKSRDMPVPRYPWAYQFVAKQGHSHLGIMMKRRNDWFRHRQLCDFFDELRDSGFFERFDNVVFYGSSMGGYGAPTAPAPARAPGPSRFRRRPRCRRRWCRGSAATKMPGYGATGTSRATPTPP